jgi:hypothetical protein
MAIWRPQPVKRGDPPGASKGYVKPETSKTSNDDMRTIPVVPSISNDYFVEPLTKNLLTGKPTKTYVPSGTQKKRNA